MKIDKNLITEISSNFGDAFYMIDLDQFESNFHELKSEFQKYYKNFNLAYSYKTNYIPILCREINRMGGYAEVVSDMEYDLAKKVGVPFDKIIFNGPYKEPAAMTELILNGGIVNIDNESDFAVVADIAKKFTDKEINVGLRCNFDIGDGVVSRFGVDVESERFTKIINTIENGKNVHLKSLQCHFATRKLETWPVRAAKMLDLIESKLSFFPDIIDLGGGLFGKMSDDLKQQFDCYIPTYADYAKETAAVFYEYFKSKNKKPLLLIEPGSALVGDVMSFVAKIISIKKVRNKDIATVLGSIYNINPTLNKKNPPLHIINMSDSSLPYKDIDMAGFTCIESDYLYKGYCGNVAQGDYAVFGNAGSYSIVLKPPFILPNFPVLASGKSCDKYCLIKRKEVFQDIFQTYIF